jgi:hypothetical protein
LRETCNRYVELAKRQFHESVAGMLTPVALFDGDARVGAAGPDGADTDCGVDDIAYGADAPDMETYFKFELVWFSELKSTLLPTAEELMIYGALHAPLINLAPAIPTPEAYQVNVTSLPSARMEIPDAV